MICIVAKRSRSLSESLLSLMARLEYSGRRGIIATRKNVTL